MRVTNNMINKNTKYNVNTNKYLVDKYNTQMTTQKKISKASEDPVIAIRSLRLSTSMSHMSQYKTNIDDAESWLDVTETALTNMKSILTDVRTQCVKGSSDTLTADDRNTILKSLSALVDQVYSEGNADYAGRTVFTGYRTTSNLTFDVSESETTYEISQTFTVKDMQEHRYYTGDVKVPAVITGDTADCATEIEQNNYERLRLAYNNIDKISSMEISLDDGSDITVDMTAGTITSSVISEDSDGDEIEVVADIGTVSTYATYEEWEESIGSQTVNNDEIVFIESTGEVIFGKEIATTLRRGNAEFQTTYIKTGFEVGEARPEYYYDCRDVSNCLDGNGDIDSDLAEKYAVDYTKENQIIEYTVATNTKMQVNTQASDVFDTSIQRDVQEMIDVVQKAIQAHDKVDQIEKMMKEEQYADKESQAKLQTYLDAATKEADYADDNLQKTYSQYITNFDNYLNKTNEAITNVGSTLRRISLTKTRVENQYVTIEELKSSNEDRDISDIMIDFYAAYNAYQASLTAASKVGSQSLLDYLR